MPAKFKAVSTLVVAMLLAFATATRAEQLSDSKFGFTLEIPDGFQKDSAAAGSNPDILYAFRKGVLEKAGAVIIIQRMHGILGRERLDTGLLPAGGKVKIVTVPWQGFDLEAFEVHEQVGPVEVVTYNVQVPLQLEAIEISVAGAHDQSRELLELVSGLLGHLQGKSNWLHSFVSGAVANSSSYGYVLVGLAGLALIAGLLFLLWVRRRTRRGTVLGFSFLACVMSAMLAPTEMREMRLAHGLISMIGAIGILIGLFDIFRRRPVSPPAELPSAPADQSSQ